MLTAPEMSPLARAILSLGLKTEPAPIVVKSLEEAGVDPGDAFEWLSMSSSEEARKISRAYNDLVDTEKRSITIDHVRESVGVDASKVLGLITEQMFLRSISVTGMIAAAHAPKVMKDAIKNAATPEGHQDRKMILQATGNAPVPKTQNTYVSIKDSNVGNRITINKNPTFEDLMREVDDLADPPMLEGR